MPWSEDDLAAVAGAVSSLVRAKGRNADSDMIAIFAHVLEHSGLDRVETLRALGKCLAIPGWIEPAKVLQVAGRLPQDSELVHHAELAFVALDMARRTVGAYGSPDFEDRAINQIVNTHPGGWPQLCEIEGKEWSTWYRRDFVERYQRLAVLGVCDGLCGPCLGLARRENAANGYECHPAARLASRITCVPQRGYARQFKVVGQGSPTITIAQQAERRLT